MALPYTRLALLTLILLAGYQLSAQKYSNEFPHYRGSAPGPTVWGRPVVASQKGSVRLRLGNPAGLAGLDPDAGLEIGAMHAEWFGWHRQL